MIFHVSCDLDLCVKFIFTYMFWKVLSHTTNWPSFITLVWKVAEKSYVFTFFVIFHVSYDLDLWVKVIFTCMSWKVLSHTTHRPSFITVVLIVSEKLSMFKFCTDGRTDGRSDGRTPDAGGSIHRLTLLTHVSRKIAQPLNCMIRLLTHSSRDWRL